MWESVSHFLAAKIGVESTPFPGYQWAQYLLARTVEKECQWKSPLPLDCLTILRT
jgi:hypothetical protein